VIWGIDPWVLVGLVVWGCIGPLLGVAMSFYALRVVERSKPAPGVTMAAPTATTPEHPDDDTPHSKAWRRL